MLGLLVVVALFLGAQGESDVDSPNLTNDRTIETYNVTTSDGYILQLKHITCSSDDSSTGPVVFLMHGLPFSSDLFTYAGMEYSMAYNLADAGFDVWMGNARGNNYSRHHVSLDADNNHTAFFDFTYEQIALYDLPAMIDLVLAETENENLHYIGHSQGATAFLVLNSMNTTYNCKFASAHLLAAIGYEDNFPNVNIKVLSNATEIIYDVLELTGTVEVTAINLTSLFLTTYLNTTVPEELISGTSINQIVHIGQNIRDSTFSRWNYGSTYNTLIYGSATAPSYNLTNIDVDVTLHYSVNDATVSEADTLAMVEAMPNAVARKVDDDSFGNMDYLLSEDAKCLVTDYIIECLNNY